MKLRSIVFLIAIVPLLGACEPRDRTPGTWLSGNLNAEPINDWSFSEEYPEVYLQTHPWYGIPHSVTTVMAAVDDTLYIPSIYYAEPLTFPEGKYWNRVAAANPDVEVQIGDGLFPRTLTLVTDEAEHALALSALARKYPFWQKVKDQPDKGPTFVIVRLDYRS